MKVVLDTNVLVSGLLHPHSSAGMIVRLVAEGQIQVVFDPRIMAEYREVLRREKFGFDQEQIELLLWQVESEGLLVTGRPLPVSLPDHDDAPFLEAALAVEGVMIVSGNKKHFPAEVCEGVTVLNPAEFIEYFARQK